jgi:hypothetical protein
VPASVTGIEKYIGSGLIKGIGPVMAKRIAKKFEKGTLNHRHLKSSSPLVSVQDKESISGVFAASLISAWFGKLYCMADRN